MSIQVGPRAARQQAPAVGPVIVAGYDGSPASRAAIADAEQRAAIGHAVVEGEPAEGLMRVARARDAREIVVGSRGLGRLRAVMGSVSHRLLERSDRPVVVVPPLDRR